MRTPLTCWKTDFLTGLAVVLPAFLSIGAVVWPFGTFSNFTDALPFFLPKSWTNERGGEGPMTWSWSLVALILAIVLVTLAGRFARHYLGRRLINLTDDLLSRVPLLNKIHGALKQNNEAFTSNKTSSFKQVVGVFVPTTPNPTTGFIVLVPQEQVIKLEIAVANGIKFIMSLGSVAPDYVLPGFAASALRPAVIGNPTSMGSDGREKAIPIPTLPTGQVCAQESP